MVATGRRYHFNSNVMSADGWRQRRPEAAWLLDRFSRVATRAQSCERSEKDSRVICFKQTAEAAHCCNLRQGESVTTEKVSKIYVCRLESTRKFQSIIIAGPSQTRDEVLYNLPISCATNTFRATILTMIGSDQISFQFLVGSGL